MLTGAKCMSPQKWPGTWLSFVKKNYTNKLSATKNIFSRSSWFAVVNNLYMSLQITMSLMSQITDSAQRVLESMPWGSVQGVCEITDNGHFTQFYIFTSGHLPLVARLFVPVADIKILLLMARWPFALTSFLSDGHLPLATESP